MQVRQTLHQRPVRQDQLAFLKQFAIIPSRDNTETVAVFSLNLRCQIEHTGFAATLVRHL